MGGPANVSPAGSQPAPPLSLPAMDLDQALSSAGAGPQDKANTISAYLSGARWIIATQGGASKSAESLEQAKSTVAKIQAWARTVRLDAPAPLRHIAREALANACAGRAAGLDVTWLPPPLRGAAPAPAICAGEAIPAAAFQDPNGAPPDGGLAGLWHPAPGSDTFGFNPLAPRPAPSPLPQRTDFEKTNPTAHGFVAVRNGNEEVIGYARSSGGYTEIRDIEGKIVRSSEIPITSDLLSPVDLLTLPFGGLAKIGLEAAGEELVAVAAKWGVREAAGAALDAAGEATAKALTQTAARLATPRGALAAAGAAYSLQGLLPSDGVNPADAQAAPMPIRASIVHVPDALKPDAIAYGVATGSAVPGSLKAGVWIISPSGNPFQFSAENGNSVFVSKPLLFGSFKGIRLGHGGVATYNPITKHLEAGWGGAANLSVASIPVVVWLNARISDVPPNFNGTVSANLGAAVSVDQLAARGLKAGSAIAAIPTPATEAAGGAMAGISGGLTAAGKFANEFVGVGYRAEIRFKDGKPEGIYYHGKELVSLEKFAEDALQFVVQNEPRPEELGMTPEAAGR